MPKRRWFQYSLRTFLVLLTAFGVWLGLHVRSANRQKEAVAAIKAKQGRVYYDFQQFDPDVDDYDRKARSWVPDWLLSKLSEDWFHNVTAVKLDHGRLDPSSAAAAIPFLEAFPKLRALYISDAQVTDEGMVHIGRLKKLEVLMIDGEGVEFGDTGAVHLQNLKRLKYLSLGKSRITDESLKCIAQMPRIETLSILENDISSRGLSSLRGMAGLKRLFIGSSGGTINDEGLANLAGLPDLELLEIHQADVSAKGLNRLANLKHLNELSLFGHIGGSGQVVLPDVTIHRFIE